VAYYVVLFDQCIDEAMVQLGLGEDYVRRANASYFTAEIHVNYLRELPPKAPVYGTCQLMAFDEKRIRVWMELFHAEEEYLSASCEQLFLHVDLGVRRTAPFPPDILEKLQAAHTAHASLPRPERASRAITFGDPA
jgi:acyl-CoA thioester hydrolase